VSHSKRHVEEFDLAAEAFGRIQRVTRELELLWPGQFSSCEEDPSALETYAREIVKNAEAMRRYASWLRLSRRLL
jgi:hypothetical protein